MPSSLPRTSPPTDAIADVGFLFALANERHASHPQAAAWFNQQAPGFQLRICRPVQIALFRLLTHPDAMGGTPLSVPETWNLFAGLLADPNIGFLHEPDQLTPAWIGLIDIEDASPRATYLASIAIAAGLPLVTLDPAFTTIPDLDIHLVA